MGEELGILLGTSPLLLLLAPSLITGLVLIFCAFRLFKVLGGRFLDVQDRQAAAFEKIADGIELMRDDLDKTSRPNEDIRITVMVMAEQINRIEERTRGQNGR